jgi:hypothetical protein
VVEFARSEPLDSNNMNHACNITLVAAFSCGFMSLAAQPAAEAGVAECAAIESAAARLDCFDALARRTRAADSAAEEAAPATQRAPDDGAPASRAAEPNRVVTVPPPAPPAAEREDHSSSREARTAERVEREQVSQVAALREIQAGRVEVTLTNGQIWRQTNSDRYNLLVGHEVRIYPTGFGRYFRLSSTEARGFIQVERVR